MTHRWPEVKLGEAVTIFDGPHATPPKQAEGPVFLGISNLDRGRLVLSEVEHISEEDFTRWTRRVTPTPGDVVFSYETRLGEAAIIPSGLKCCLGRRMGLLRPKSGCVDHKFLLYSYLGPFFQEVIRQRTIHGSTVDRIPLLEMGDFPILLPPILEQRRIAAVLSALDGKIELNRQTNETLEAMMMALFKSWFVDFDPVRARMEGRPPARMNASTAALFPDSLCETEGALLPKGWSTLALDEKASFLNGLALQKFPASEGEPFLPVIKIAQLRAGNSVGADRASLSVPSSHRIDDGDLIFSWSGSLLVRLWVGGPGALNQHLFKVTSSTFPRWFIHGWLRHHLPGFQAIAADKATTMGHIQRHHLTEAKIVAPSADLLSEAGRLMAPLEEQIIQNDKESRSLRELRDELLPRLLSGEVRVRDAERAAEAAV